MTENQRSDAVMNYMLLLTAFCLPWAKPALPLLLALLGICGVWRCWAHKRVFKPSHTLPLWTSSLTYVLLALSVLLGFCGPRAHEILEIKFSYIALPLMAFLLAPIHPARIKRLYMAFILGCLGYDCIAFTHALCCFAQSHDVSVLYYQNLGWYIHPSYQAMYHGFAIFILAKHLVEKSFIAWSQTISLVLIVIFSFMIAALASKAGIISLSLIGLAFVVYSLARKHSVKLILMAATLSFIGMVSFNYGITGVSSRISEAGKDIGTLTQTGAEEMLNSTAYSSVTLRVVSWSAAFQILLAHPFGSGVGMASARLDEYYLAHGQPYAASIHLNAHQQFLQHGLDLGWIGVILLLSTFALLALRLIKLKNHVGVAFIVLCAINFMLESMLETQAGIIFFFFWLMIFCSERENSSTDYPRSVSASPLDWNR